MELKKSKILENKIIPISIETLEGKKIKISNSKSITIDDKNRQNKYLYLKDIFEPKYKYNKIRKIKANNKDNNKRRDIIQNKYFNIVIKYLMLISLFIHIIPINKVY